MKHYIYGLMDPESRCIRYVGRSTRPERRLTEHLQDTNTGKGVWLQTLLRKGMAPLLVILEECHEESNAARREAEWVKWGEDAGWPLLNFVFSGERKVKQVIPDSSLFPIRQGRPLTQQESQRFRRMAEAGEFDRDGKFSMNKAMAHVYGSKNPERASWIREALEGVNYA